MEKGDRLIQKTNKRMDPSLLNSLLAAGEVGWGECQLPYQQDCQGELSGNQYRHVLFNISFIFGPEALGHKVTAERKHY